MKRKILAIILAALMLCSILPVMASAENESYTINNGTVQDANGSIALPENAQAGDTVTVSVTPNEGYELSSLTYTPLQWSVIGSFCNWAVDIPMTEREAGVFVSPAITLTASDTFKIRKNAGWDKNYGLPLDSSSYIVDPSGVVFALVNNGGDMLVPRDGDYIFIFRPGDCTITVTDSPAFASEPESIPITADDAGSYKFEMPGYAVCVTAVFEEKTITIADILNTVEGFPITDGENVPENAWKNDNGNICVRGKIGAYDDLYFGEDLGNFIRISCGGTAEECEGGYEYNQGSKNIVFHMENDVLTSIDLSGDGSYDGTYTVPTSAHDLIVTKNGAAAIEGTDYAWGEGTNDPNMMFIKTNDLTVSGTTAREFIQVQDGVTSFTIKDLTITTTPKSYSPLGFVGNCTLNVSGNNVITPEKYDAINSLKDLTITGDGKLHAGPESAGTGVYVMGKLTISVAGELIVSGAQAMRGLKGIDIPLCTGKILVYGSEPGLSAMHCGREGVVTLGKEVNALGTTAITAEESEITQPAHFTGEGMAVGGVYAGSILIQKGTPSTPGDNGDNGGNLTWLWILLCIILLLILIYIIVFFIWKKNEELPTALKFLGFLVPSYKAINKALFKKDGMKE